jgi:hypothetical protein
MPTFPLPNTHNRNVPPANYQRRSDLLDPTALLDSWPVKP